MTHASIVRVVHQGRLSISVVIACRNAGATMELCLAALAKSSLAVDECIVVDDASTDDSRSIARRCGAHVITRPVRGGPAKARNLGAGLASGDVLLFLDADVCVHAGSVARIAEHFRSEQGLDAVIGSYDDTPAEASFVSQYRNLLHCFTHRSGRRRATTFWCGCGAVRRDRFLSLGGLPEEYSRPSIEDIEFGRRLAASGGTILLDPAIQVKHLKRWTLAGMLRTDIFDRAIPWARLILRNGSMPDDLSVRWSQRVSVLLALTAPSLAVFGRWRGALLCECAVVTLNRGFYSFLISKRGVWFALRAVPLHLAYHLYSGFAFGIATLEHGFAFRSAARQGASRRALT